MKQPPITDGPFHLNLKTSWSDFIENVAKVTKITKESAVAAVTDMKWSFQKKAAFPLKDITGFQTMMQQVRGLKDVESAIIIVVLPVSASKH